MSLNRAIDRLGFVASLASMCGLPCLGAEPCTPMQRRIGMMRFVKPAKVDGLPSLDIPVVCEDEVTERELTQIQTTHPFVVLYATAPEGQAIADRRFEGVPVVRATIRQGPMTFPVLRVDDYPTGIRPLQQDKTPIRNVLLDLDRQEIPYVLGISPGLLDRSDVAFLRSLKYMVPSVHGLDHNYFRYASGLLQSGDIYNRHSMSGLTKRIRNRLTPFHQSEFVGLHPEIARDRLRLAKDRLEEVTEREVHIFTATFDRAPENLCLGLESLGFKVYLSQKQTNGCSVPWLRSDFYGRSTTLEPERRHAAPCLHTLWEWDLVREYGGHNFDRVGAYVREIMMEIGQARQSVKRALKELRSSPVGKAAIA